MHTQERNREVVEIIQQSIEERKREKLHHHMPSSHHLDLLRMQQF